MQAIFFNTSNDTKVSSNILSNVQSKTKGEINEGMTPNEIANIISDHLINVVKKQFLFAKESYLNSIKNSTNI